MSADSSPAPVVVGIDPVTGPTAALAWAARFAAAHRTPLHLVSAVPPIVIDPGGVMIVSEDITAGARQHALEQLEAARATTLDQFPDLTISVEVRDVSPAQALVEASDRATLLFVGTNPHPGVIGRLIGSIADQVVTHAKGPVVVVPEDCPQPRWGPVVVGLDSAEPTSTALPMAYLAAADTHCDLIAIHAWELEFGWAGTPVAIEQDQIVTMLEDQRRRLVERVEQVGLDYPTVHASTVIQRDRSAHALIEASKSASLLVVGNRGSGGFADLLLGSTSRRVLHGAHCPVLVVHGRRH